MSHIEILSNSECIQLMERFPNIELSYEIVPHKKVQMKYNICLAIPVGRKCYAWFTFYKNRDVCFIMDINRDKKVSNISIVNINFNPKNALGTVLYGSVLENTNTHYSVFIIEDILVYNGIPMRDLFFSDKLGFIERFVLNDVQNNSNDAYIFACATIWGMESNVPYDCVYTIPHHIVNDILYPIHHIQYRCLNEIAPYLNVFNKRINNSIIPSQTMISHMNPLSSRPIKPDYNKPQYRMPTVFLVTADIKYDVYHLFACGKNTTPVYYGVAGIQNYRTSIFMNRIFRNIVENHRLDAIEESDDDEDFQNTAADKYVDLKKVCMMECVFNSKFKKWIPVRLINNKDCKYVHISKLVI